MIVSFKTPVSFLFLALGSLIFLYTNKIFCQVHSFSFNQITIEDGLTENDYNWIIYRDTRGIVWISSNNGIFRYDGLEIDHILLNQGIPDPIQSENIQSGFFEDKNGNLWFTTYEALNVLKRANHKVYTFRVGKPKVTKNYRAFFLNPKSGNLWLKAGDLLYKFNTTSYTDSLISDSLTYGYNFVVDTFHNGEIKKIYSVFWEKPGMDIFENNSGNYTVTRKFQHTTLPYHKSNPKILDGVLEHHNKLWLFTDQGLILFEPGNDTLKVQRFVPPDYENLQFNTGLIFNDSTLLLVSKREGIWSFNTESHEFIQRFHQSGIEESSILSNNVNALYLDKDDRLWISYQDIGVAYSNLKPFKLQFKNQLKNNQGNPQRITKIAQNNKKEIWLGTESKNLFVVSENGDSIISFDYNTNQDKELNIETLRDLKSDWYGNIWCVGTNKIYKLQDKIWELIFKSNIHKFRHIFHLEQDKTIILTSDGVYDILDNQPNIKLVPRKESFFNSPIPYSFIQFFQVSSGKILIPFQDTELWICEYQNDQFNIKTKLIINAEIYNIEERATDRSIFLGTSEGLVILDSTFAKVTPRFIEKQLGTFNIYGVFQSKNGDIWTSSNSGLYSINLKSSTISRYGIEDGLDSEDFSPYAALKASDGKIWFGHKAGVAVFHPDSIAPYPHTPNPYIMKLLVDNVPFQGDTVIGEATRITLDHRSNRLAFEMKAIGYHYPELNTLEYRLLGYDDKWVTLKNGEHAVFTKIPAREQNYVLEYRAFNLNGKPSEIKSLNIYIEPPLIQKLWFQILLFVVVMLIAYAYYRYRIAQIRKEAAYKQMIAETETAVLRLQMNPHFIFNSMNSISSYILTRDIATANDYLGRFARLMRMILDYAAKPLIEVAEEEELLELYLQAESMRFEGRFEYAIEYDEEFDPDEFLIPPMILQPFVENAILHGFTGKKEKGFIKIRFWEAQDSLWCSVEDNGIGRKAAASLNLKAKAHESKALSITERRMQLLERKKGVVPSLACIDLFDENNLPSGTKVVLRFPVL